MSRITQQQLEAYLLWGTAADCLRRMAQRRAVWPDERGDIELAIEALGSVGDDHSLADLHRTLSAAGVSMAYVSHEQAALLIAAAGKLERSAPTS